MMSPTNHVDRMTRYHVGQLLSIFRPNGGESGILFEATVVSHGDIGRFLLGEKLIVFRGITMRISGSEQEIFAMLECDVYETVDSLLPCTNINLADVTEPTDYVQMVDGTLIAFWEYNFDDGSIIVINHEGILLFEILQN